MSLIVLVSIYSFLLGILWLEFDYRLPSYITVGLDFALSLKLIQIKEDVFPIDSVADCDPNLFHESHIVFRDINSFRCCACAEMMDKSSISPHLSLHISQFVPSHSRNSIVISFRPSLFLQSGLLLVPRLLFLSVEQVLSLISFCQFLISF